MYQQIDSNKRRTWLLIFIFVVFVLFLGWILGQWQGTGYGGLILAGIIALIMTLISYYKGDSIALGIAGAKPIAKKDNPYVYRMVENLCITAGLPLPKVYIIEDGAMNAFATGRDPEHASVALTRGIIEKLENEELEGVIAHELSHVKNYDIRLMTVVVVLVGTVAMVTHIFWRTRFLRGGRRRGGGQAGAIIAIVGILALILSPIVANLIKFAVSRRREYLADASGALLTRYPDGLASALEKLAQQDRPLRKASPATAHLYITNPFGGVTKGVTNLFQTHPPVQERVKKLRAMTGHAA
ncbi:MAG: M48 family metalloprotease [Patescibacteria group bacterium]